MFGKYDKVNLALINAKDVNGKILPFSSKLPLDGDCSLPDGLISIDVAEYHEGSVNGGRIVFSVYVGEISTIYDTFANDVNKNVKIRENVKPDSIETPVLIQNISGHQVVSAVIDEQDVVVADHEQMVAVIEQLSDHFNRINDSVVKIRTLSKDNRNIDK